MVEDRRSHRQAYETGRGGFRAARALGEGSTASAASTVVVTEIPYQVQKAKLIEQIAELMEEKKLPLLGDVRDESDRRRSASCWSRRPAASSRKC